jgi:hypothetical protein
MLHRSRRAWLLLLAAALAARSSADRRIAEGEEPIAALQVRHRSQRYDTGFWAAQARGSTALWAIALQFCRGEGRDLAAHPNCASVIAADAQTQGAGRGAQRRSGWRRKRA